MRKDMGASAKADQALVASDQAASRLAPTGFDPSRWPEMFVSNLPWKPMADAPRDGTVFAACYYPWNVKTNPLHIQAVQWLPSAGGMTFAFRQAYQPDSEAYAEGWLTFDEMSAIAMEAAKPDRPRSGLDPEGDSAGPKDIAQIPPPSTPRSNQ